MTDVLVSPRVPKPWLAHQKEESVLHPRFISAGSSTARANLKRSFPFGDCSSRSSVSGSWESTLDPSMPMKYRRLQPRRLPSTEPTHVSTRGSSSSMSHTPSMAHHHPAVTSSHCYPSERTELPSTTTMPPYTTLMTAPPMKTTASSSGSSITEAEHNPFGSSNEPLLPSSIDTTVGLAHSMASTDPMWAMKTPSFGAGTDDSPSISSSFDFTDLPKQEQPAHHGLPLYNHHSASQAIDNPFYLDCHDAKFVRTTISGSTEAMPWCEWPVSGPTDPWSHAITADEQIWPSTEYQTCFWPGQEALLNTAVDTHHLQTIPPSPIEHHIPFKTTSTPTTSSPDTQHTAPIPTHPEPNNNYPNPHIPLRVHSQWLRPYPPTSPATSNPEPTTLIHPRKPPSPQQQHPQAHKQSSNPVPEPPKEPIKASLHYTDTRNAFLIECKRRGLSYKDIKRIGGFKEAESTLRGRFRTLTKAKEQRVRKPKWQERDIELLVEGVLACSAPQTPTTSYPAMTHVQTGLGLQQPPKVSWKKVAQYIWANGGSYQFGNATCKKKWCEIHGMQI